jgi:hypothetical protein
VGLQRYEKKMKRNNFIDNTEDSPAKRYQEASNNDFLVLFSGRAGIPTRWLRP